MRNLTGLAMGLFVAAVLVGVLDAIGRMFGL
jgi:tetrahydromethanopterin S-methyltransferase subunit F